MTEVGQRFSTRTEERLLAVVYTLQQRTYKTGLLASSAVPEGFKKELAGALVCLLRCILPIELTTFKFCRRVQSL